MRISDLTYFKVISKEKKATFSLPLLIVYLFQDSNPFIQDKFQFVLVLLDLNSRQKKSQENSRKNLIFNRTFFQFLNRSLKVHPFITRVHERLHTYSYCNKIRNFSSFHIFRYLRNVQYIISSLLRSAGIQKRMSRE